MILREYQSNALLRAIDDLPRPGASIICMPTGSGKSHVIAKIAMQRSPVLILQPSVELVRQNKAKLEALVDPNNIGVYSASFGTKDIRTFTFATIQSVFRKPELFKDVQLIIIDECHLVSPRNLDSVFSSFLSKLPGVKVLGLTASPFRVELTYIKEGEALYAASGIKMINRMYMKGTSEPFWKRIIYTISHKKLLEGGYLCPLEYIHEPLLPYEAIPINVSHSDFNLEKYSQMVIGMEAQILNTIAEAQKRFKSVLVFAAEVGQAERLSEIVKGSRVVVGTTKKKERERIIEDFKNGKIQTVFNCNCLSTGFDHSDLQCIILLRPCRSPLLILQILGRLTRPNEGKKHGTVIDLTGTMKSFGPIESFEIYLRNGWAWDFRTANQDSWHGKLLFKQKLTGGGNA